MQRPGFSHWLSLPWFLTEVPAARAENIERPRITTLLDELTESAPLVIVSAPSGFGKTSALAEWAHKREGVSWLSVSAAVDSWRLLNGGLLGLVPPAVRAQLAEQPSSTVSPSVLDLVEHIPEASTLVIDDAHLLEPEVIRDTLCSPALLSSGRLRIVLIGQPVLEQSFSREVAIGDANLIGASALALTSDEIGRILEGADTQLTLDEVVASTGGWPAAVRLHIMSAVADLSSEADAPPSRLLADYIENVVLRAVPDELRQFILRAATCSRLDGTLADALFESDSGAQKLEECFKTGLFLDRFVDPDGRMLYRWHDAFAEQCRAMLMREDPHLARRMNRVAAERLTHLYPPEAIRHALLGDAPDVARSIIRRYWLRMTLESQTSVLENLCLTLPGKLAEERDILLIRACCRNLLNDRAGAQLLRQRAQSKPQLCDTEFIESFADILLASTPAEKAAATDRAAEVLGQGTPDDDYPHGLFVLGWSEVTLRRDGEASVKLLLSALHEAQSRRLPHLARAAGLNAAFAFSFVGKFSLAETTLDQLARSSTGAVGDWERFEGGAAGYVRGHNRFWRGELHEALDYFSAMVTAGNVNTSAVALSRAFYAMTVAELGRTDLYETAEQHLTEIGNEDQNGVPWETYKRLATGRLLEVQGNMPQARLAVDPLLARDDIPVTLALLAELYRRAGEHAHARVAVGRLKSRKRPAYVSLMARTTLAAIDHAEGRTEASHKRLSRSIANAVEHETFFPFLATDAAFTQMLEDFTRSGSTHEEPLAAIFALRDRIHGHSTHSRLTPRERELLGFLRTSMTADEIATALHLSVATVKTHLQSIYRKLGVSSRREAVRIAR